MMDSVQVRPATANDYPAFAALVPELGVGDPVPSHERFLTDLRPTVLIAESGDGMTVGYAYFQCMQTTLHVRHVVVAPAVRACGVGRLLMRAIEERARESMCTQWCLNVKPENIAAVALYLRCGMAHAFVSHYLRFDWSALSDLLCSTVDPLAGVHVREIAVIDEPGVEVALRMISGQLQTLRAQSHRVLLMLEEGDKPVAAAAFDPTFPGASPFRVTHERYALALLQELRPYARPADTFLNLMVEDHAELTRHLVALGASIRLELLHMRGNIAPNGAA